MIYVDIYYVSELVLGLCNGSDDQPPVQLIPFHHGLLIDATHYSNPRKPFIEIKSIKC